MLNNTVLNHLRSISKNELLSHILYLSGSQYVSDRSFNHEFGSGWNNAMHEYGTITSTFVDSGRHIYFLYAC